MINIIPENDDKEHEECSTCHCRPKVFYENGEMIIVHNSFDGREQLEFSSGVLINAHTEELELMHKNGLMSIDDMEDLLKTAEEEQEFEIAISLRDALNKLK